MQLEMHLAMDIAQLAQRLTLTTRQVRYVLDHRLVPGIERAGQGRGISRQFSAPEAVRIACAALLRAAGFRQHAVRHCLERLEQPPAAQELPAPASSLPVTSAPAALPSRENNGIVTGLNEHQPSGIPGGDAPAAAFQQRVVQAHIDLAALRRRLQE